MNQGMRTRDWAMGMRTVRCIRTAAAVLLCTAVSARAGFTPLASYELAESDLTVTAGGGDAGLTVSRVAGGVNEAPAATDGDYVLKVDFAGEDGKVEIRHAWTASTYDLAGELELLADVYIATPSALPGLMGIWSPNWSPPDAWQIATNIPNTVGAWTTVSFNVSTRQQVGLDEIWAFILEEMPGDTGTAYIDNLRLRHPSPDVGLEGLAVNAYAMRNELIWKPAAVVGLDGYNVYRADDAAGPFTQCNDALVTEAFYADEVGPDSGESYYRVTFVEGGEEAPPSATVSAVYNGYTDEQLLDVLQGSTFQYFWNGAHPNCGMAREGIGMGHDPDRVTTGGTGMGLITIMVGVERGFVTRAEAANRVLTILTFLQDTATRYHGAWSHHIDGDTGETLSFAGEKDNGGDLVETAFLIEGMLTVRQYFDDPADPVETEIRNRATQMWEEVEWDWYRQHPGSDVLYWHWSPDHGFELNHAIRGYNEAQIVYILAVASPTHPMPPSAYTNGWAGNSYYFNGGTYCGNYLWVGPAFGGPMFFTHYSNLGFDPRDKRDAYCNYFENARAIARIHHAYCIENPNDHAGYNGFTWGLTASFNPWGYSAHSPTNDNGTITPTAALSSMPYTPRESLWAMRQYFDKHLNGLWGGYGFKDALHPGEDWYAPGWIAIDQGPIVPMIENYRTGLCWRMFMKNPEIEPALRAMGWTLPGDLDADGDMDTDDYALFAGCFAGPGVESPPAGCTLSLFENADLDNDGDVDEADYAVFQRRFETP